MRWFPLDRVTELVVGERARGIKNVTLSEDFLHDHFPTHPIYPGVLILESAAQLAGFLLEQTWHVQGDGRERAVLVGVRNAKFHSMATPGDQLDLEVSLTSRLDEAAEVDARVKVGERKVARAELTFVIRPVDSEGLHAARRAVYELWTRTLDPRPVLR